MGILTRFFNKITINVLLDPRTKYILPLIYSLPITPTDAIQRHHGTPFFYMWLTAVYVFRYYRSPSFKLNHRSSFVFRVCPPSGLGSSFVFIPEKVQFRQTVRSTSQSFPRSFSWTYCWTVSSYHSDIVIEYSADTLIVVKI